MGSTSLTRDRTQVLALGGWSLGHWASREVPSTEILKMIGSSHDEGKKKETGHMQKPLSRRELGIFWEQTRGFSVSDFDVWGADGKTSVWREKYVPCRRWDRTASKVLCMPLHTALSEGRPTPYTPLQADPWTHCCLHPGQGMSLPLPQGESRQGPLSLPSAAAGPRKAFLKEKQSSWNRCIAVELARIALRVLTFHFQWDEHNFVGLEQAVVKLFLSCVCVLSHSPVSASSRASGLQPARLLCPWHLQPRTLEWVSFPPPGGLPDPGTEDPALQVDSFLPRAKFHPPTLESQ